jgi:hypothetical protein
MHLLSRQRLPGQFPLGHLHGAVFPNRRRRSQDLQSRGPSRLLRLPRRAGWRVNLIALCSRFRALVLGADPLISCDRIGRVSWCRLRASADQAVGEPKLSDVGSQNSPTSPRRAKIPLISKGAGRRESGCKRVAYQDVARPQSWSMVTTGRSG